MRIGELAQRTGVTTRALRFYEDQGLLTARRSANGYRVYTRAHATPETSLFHVGFRCAQDVTQGR